MTKGEAIKRLEVIVKHSEGGNYHYKIKANDWEKRDPETNEVVKARTYLSIVETRENSKHYTERRYGYIDNLTGEYVVEKNDIMKNYTFSGSKFEEEVEEVEEAKEAKEEKESEGNMIIKIYGYQNNEGKIECYKPEFVKNYNGGCALELEVEFPDFMNASADAEREMIWIEDKGETYCVNQYNLLKVSDSRPAILLPASNKIYTLGVINEKWVDTAMTL